MSTTPEESNEFDGSELEPAESHEINLDFFETVEKIVKQYDNVLMASDESNIQDRQFYSDNFIDMGFNTVPRMEAYDKDIDMVEEINSLDGEVLLVGLGLDNHVPYVSERGSSDYSFEGNWWDNVADLEVDVLLDRTSYEGAVDIPYGVDIERFSPEDYSQEMYMVTQNNP